MDAITDWLIGFVSGGEHLAGLLVLAGSSALEYVFPPFPGDTITLLGAVLITAYGWSFWSVFGAVMAGSLAGSMAAFYLGSYLRRRRADRPDTARRVAIQGLVDKFERHGAVYLVLNRFLPGIRSLFFVAAGMAGMRAGLVAIFSALSAGLWNLALIALGGLLGANFDTMLGWVQTYTTVAWIALGAIVAALVARAIVRRRRARASDDGGPDVR